MGRLGEGVIQRGQGGVVRQGGYCQIRGDDTPHSINRKYCILGEHEFSREHHQKVDTYSMHTNHRVRNRVGTSPVRVTTQLILISHVGLMIH